MSAHALSDKERLAWLRLARTPTIGPATFATLIARFGSATAALAEVPNLARRGGNEALKLPSQDDVTRELDALTAFGGRIIASIEPDFPQGLAALEAPPPLIAIAGNAALFRREMIAIVGARNASALGRKFAGDLARDLSDAGLVVVSGMARGIDVAAHEGALAGGTVAVLAGGIDNIYPPEHKSLYGRLREAGALVSEMPFGLVPQARHFPRRNRIISGMARGVIVVEAADGSGSLITANYALEQSREVFAVPGSPLDPRARGTNRLLREGATMVETAQDVLAVLRPMLGQDFREPDRARFQPPMQTAGNGDDTRTRTAVVEALGPAPVEVDELIRLAGVPAHDVLAILLELEIAGKLARHPGNRVSWA